MHPVIVGKPAYPALAVRGPGGLRAPGVAVVISRGDAGEDTLAVLEAARGIGLLTVALLGPGSDAPADFVFSAPGGDPAVVQEIQETAYHLLWELVHLFAESAPAGDVCITCGDTAVAARVIEAEGGIAVVESEGVRGEVATELVADVRPGDVLLCHAGVALERAPGGPEAGSPGTGDASFLYPFLGGAGSDPEALLGEACRAVAEKAAETSLLRGGIDLAALRRAAAAIGARLESGGRLLAFGNGGSSTDAQDLAADLAAAGWDARALTEDVATVTALGNDVGFNSVFARQLIALGSPGDVALAISTSGASENVVEALAEARRRGMLSCAISGYGAGRLEGAAAPDHLLVVPGEHVPRIQEAQATAYHLLAGEIGRAP